MTKSKICNSLQKIQMQSVAAAKEEIVNPVIFKKPSDA